MGVRGPKSKAELAVVASGGVTATERQRAPVDLTDEQRAEWMAVVAGLPADRFTREQVPMLAAHCRHTVAQRRIAQLIEAAEKAEEFDVNEYDRLLKMQERESRCLASLAVRLGFAYSTAYEKRPPKGGKHTPKPWEFES